MCFPLSFLHLIRCLWRYFVFSEVYRLHFRFLTSCHHGSKGRLSFQGVLFPGVCFPKSGAPELRVVLLNYTLFTHNDHWSSSEDMWSDWSWFVLLVSSHWQHLWDGALLNSTLYYQLCRPSLSVYSLPDPLFIIKL